MIDGLRVGMKHRSPRQENAKVEKEPLTVKHNKAKMNASYKFLDLNESLEYGSEN